jgi:hypothetical protein
MSGHYCRESCLAENQHLLARLEDTNAMLQETQKSKEVAVAEIRCMVQTQDMLRREIQQSRYGLHVFEELVPGFLSPACVVYPDRYPKTFSWIIDLNARQRFYSDKIVCYEHAIQYVQTSSC